MKHEKHKGESKHKAKKITLRQGRQRRRQDQ